MEPGSCLQHKSRSSLLRRMPVRGEYTMAPKLRMGKVGSELGALAPSNTGLQPLRIPYKSASSTTEPGTTQGPQRSPLAPIRNSFLS